ncbi:replicative DNA helicase [Moraxella sp. FZLJ2107]|uniref:replicative DNA helicase n=1 Tax=unclassified Moraxella TaxID=2685852 RepID=UPI00209C6261|nr:MULTISPECIES: replicative DNA helicase [unclassified Moraxella]USZ14695.1 replicative DNA helicase [Moraxella sp. FZFQ2102]UTO05362.1 replicative DNA helicase [Moraxella sp. FZLJ2107]UTO22097.1 replicative DNA helicase [Moraxella sp. FZLJ2109]
MTDTSTRTDSLLTLQPPHNIEMERSLLASLMGMSESFDSIDTIISADDFYGERHKKIFDAISHLARINEPYDSLMVHDYLSRVDQLSAVGGEEYLLQINQSPVSFFNLVNYAEKVRDLAVYRQLIKSANTMLNLAYHPKKQTVTEILDTIEADIFRIGENFAKGTNKEGPQRIDDVLTNVSNLLSEIRLRDGGLVGIDTGFEELNNKTLGFQAGNLIILAARPAMGKTALALNFAQAALNANKAAVVFSMEMPAESIAMRMISAWGRIHQAKLMAADMEESEWAMFMSATAWLQDKHLYIDSRSELTPSEVRATCRRLAKNHPDGLGLVVIDYLQLMRVHGMDSRVNEIGEISRSLKALARELNCPVIALSQLNRSLESRPNKRPMMSDLRESGQIEQDADLILFVYRHWYYHQDKPEIQNQAELIIGKNRSGERGTVPLRFLGEYARFENLLNDEEFAYLEEDDG